MVDGDVEVSAVARVVLAVVAAADRFSGKK